MRPTSEMTPEGLPPSPLPLDDTPVPPEVQDQVDALQADGKRVNVKVSADEYAKLMQMPHAARLEFALRVLKRQEQRHAAKSTAERVKADGRKRKRASAKDRRRQRRKSGR